MSAISEVVEMTSTHAIAAPSRWKPSTRVRVISDVAIFTLLLALSAPETTGLALHEWLVLPFIPVFMGHLITSWPQITAMFRRQTRPKGRQRTNQIVNLVSFVLMITAVYSGLAISVELLPSIGLGGQPRSFWLSVHSASASLLIPLLAAHLYLHWRWVRRHVLHLSVRPGPVVRRGNQTGVSA